MAPVTVVAPAANVPEVDKSSSPKLISPVMSVIEPAATVNPPIAALVVIVTAPGNPTVNVTTPSASTLAKLTSLVVPAKSSLSVVRSKS